MWFLGSESMLAIKKRPPILQPSIISFVSCAANQPQFPIHSLVSKSTLWFLPNSLMLDSKKSLNQPTSKQLWSHSQLEITFSIKLMVSKTNFSNLCIFSFTWQSFFLYRIRIALQKEYSQVKQEGKAAKVIYYMHPR